MDDKMTPTKDNTEDPTAELRQEVPSAGEASSEPPTGKFYAPTRTSTIGRWILILLATLIIGFGTAFFAMALPARQALRQSQSDLATAQESLTTSEANLKATKDDLVRTKAELEEVEFELALARVQVNVAYARSSLVSRDLLTARQEVSAAVENFQLLLPYITDKDVATALSDRMDGIDKMIYTDSARALEELRTFSENLLRLKER